MPTLTTFNANNFFLRYKFANTYPGDQSKKSAATAVQAVSTGFVPGRTAGKSYIVWDPVRRDLAAQALREPDGRLPDILCLQEVENLPAIRVLNERHFGGYYDHLVLIDSYDERNIDVAVMSRFPFETIRTHVDDTAQGGKRLFSRDCLEVDIKLPSGETLSLLVNHLKSKYVQKKKGDTQADLRAKLLDAHKHRLEQATAVARLVDSRFRGRHSSALYAVVGDFNDTPESPWTKPLDESGHLIDSVARHRAVDDRWTYYWRAKGHVSQIDRILVSEELGRRVDRQVASSAKRTPYIERAGLAYRDLSAQDGKPLPAEVSVMHFEPDDATPAPAHVTPSTKVAFQFDRYEPIFDDASNNTSDHCPVKIWF